VEPEVFAYSLMKRFTIKLLTFSKNLLPPSYCGWVASGSNVLNPEFKGLDNSPGLMRINKLTKNNPHP